MTDRTIERLRAGQPLLWMSDRDRAADVSDAADDADAAVARFARSAPLLAQLFPELAATGGVVESELVATPRMQRALGVPEDFGTLFVKGDHALPVAGSVKARGGLHEVLEHAEALAVANGVLAPDDDRRVLASPAARALFAGHQVAVGSTGNLGLAIGVAASALGFRATVHMSADAKAWKKERLRRRGVEVVEHAGDYAAAVAAGRRDAAADPRCHFVDDERSASLFAGYAAAAPHFARQLAAAGRRVDAGHPLFVYLPCGVGGAPGGIAYGLARIHGPHVHCVFAEPTRSPCFLVRMLLGPHSSVYDVGLDNRTEADGLAVPRASELAAEVAGPFVAGVCTVDDETLLRDLYLAETTEGLRIEPSAAAGFSGPSMLTGTDAGRAYLRRHDLKVRMDGATHVVWTTGGLFVPDDEYARFRARGAAVSRSESPR